MALLSLLAKLSILGLCLAFAYELGEASAQGPGPAELVTWLQAVWSLVADLSEAFAQLR